jgi:hypothetical protein
MKTTPNTAAEALRIIEQLHDETNQPTPDEQPTAEALVQIVDSETIHTLRNSDTLTVKGRSAYVKADKIQNPNRAEIVIHYEAGRNGTTSSGSLTVVVETFTEAPPRHYVRERYNPSIWNGNKFASYPPAAMELIEQHYFGQISKLITANPAEIITAGHAHERRLRTSNALHKAKMALDDVVRGIDR